MLLGLCGRRRSGKDTTALVLGHADRGQYRRVAFADALKDFAAHAFGLKLDAFGDEWKEKSIGRLDFADGKITRSSRPEHPVVTPRWLLQRLGVAARATFGDDFWIRRVLDEVKAGTFGHNVVITDVRFLNEAQAVKAAGGLLVRLNRTDEDEPHEFVADSGVPKAKVPGCNYWYPRDGGWFCGWPAHAHPLTWTPDQHQSENDLPCRSNEWVTYDFEVTSTSADTTARAVVAWLRGSTVLAPVVDASLGASLGGSK